MDVPRDTPLVIYDGACRFCRRWIERWRGVTATRVAYAPYQDVAGQFPGIDPHRFRRAIQFVDRDGAVCEGAEAVFCALAEAPGRGAGLWSYRHVPGFAPVAEWMYARVAAHRTVLPWLAMALWGGVFAPSTYVLTRWLIVRLVGVVYLIAFASLLVQVQGLAGSSGIMPAAERMDVARERGASFFDLPTLAWWAVSDGALWWGCIVGMVLAAGIIVRVLPVASLLLAWALYLSYVCVCTPFLNFQWDIFLLEVGFLCIFVESWSWRPQLATERPPSGPALWMLRLCLLKLMVASGMVKLLAGDAVWNDLSALTYHYWTQPIPNGLAWYAHHLPLWTHQASCLVMFIIELVLPFAMFLSRPFRITAGVGLILLQVLIALTGNYTFFNLLTAALAVVLLDDRFLCRLVPRVRDRLHRRLSPVGVGRRRVGTGVALAMGLTILCLAYAALSASATWSDWQSMKARLANRRADHTYEWLALPPLVESGHAWLQAHGVRPIRPWRTVNAYGLFRDMTERRPELVIEGSRDRQTWLAYEFKYKPGDLTRMPPFVAPHQPRLDWQMWFEALRAEPQMNNRRRRPSQWFVAFLSALRDGNPQVAALLERDPFPDDPPRYVRAILYRYTFTTPEQHAATGQWWSSQDVGIYLVVAGEATRQR